MKMTSAKAIRLEMVLADVYIGLDKQDSEKCRRTFLFSKTHHLGHLVVTIKTRQVVRH